MGVSRFEPRVLWPPSGVVVVVVIVGGGGGGGGGNGSGSLAHSFVGTTPVVSS